MAKVNIEVEIEDDLLLAAAIRAHEMDMKLNDYIVMAIEWALEKWKAENPEIDE